MPTIEQARGWYSAADPVHGFDHVMRVYRLAEQLARQEGADLEIVAAAVLLHDAQANLPVDMEDVAYSRSDHHMYSAELAARVLGIEGWSAERVAAVQHCIQAHRYRDDVTVPQSLEARVVFDADKLDAIGAVGVARAIAYAVTHGQPFYAPPSARFLESGLLEPGEPHSAYHEYVFKLINIQARLYTPSGQRLALDRQGRMQAFFEGVVLEMEG